MSKRQSNPGYGKAFTFHGSFVSLILARRKEREIPGSFIHQHKGRYYVLKPKKIRMNPRSWSTKFIVGDLVYVDRSQVAPSLAKDLFWRVFVDRAVIREISKDKKRYRIEFPFGKSYWFDEEALEFYKGRSSGRLNPRKKRACYVIPNPQKGILIYGRVLKIFAQKTSGPYKGERFVHEFKPGALMYGMPDGSLKIIHK